MNQTIGVNIVPQSPQPTLHYSQGDVGRVFVVNVTDYDIPTGATVTCVATKPSGMGFTVSGTVSGNSVTFTSTAEMTDEWGRFPAEIRIASGNTLLGTANFLMIGEKNPHPASTIDGTQEELIPQLTLLVNRVEAAAESVHDLTVSATTLTAGSEATARYDSANNSITFGIPRGADGDVTRSEFNDLKSGLSDETSARILLAGRVTTAESDIDTLETHKVAQPLDGNNQPTNGTSGQLLRTKGDGTTEWADVGLPTDAQTEEAINKWLDDHPEATTTVLDGSITEAKFSAALKLKAIKDYVTPEMFGATGNGVTDDSVAIQAAIDFANEQGGGVVQFGDKTYRCQGLVPKDNVTLRGTPRARLKLPNTPSDHLISYYSDTIITNFNLINLQFDGNGQTTYDLVHIEKATLSPVTYIWDKSVIDSCWFNYGRIGLLCSIPGNVKIISCIFQSNDIGLEQEYEHFHIVASMFWGNRIGANLKSANHFTWVNATFAHNKEYGIYANGSNQSILCACNFIDNPKCISGLLHNYRILGCRFVNCGTGIDGAKFSNVINGCYFFEMSTVAISMLEAGTSNNVISNNEFTSNNKDIVISGSDQLINGNHFLATQEAAIELAAGGDGNVLGIEIANNTVLNSSEKGNALYSAIEITATHLTAILISNNLIRNNGVGKTAYAINMNMTPTGLFDILIANNVSRAMKTAGYRWRDNANITAANNIGAIVTF